MQWLWYVAHCDEGQLAALAAERRLPIEQLEAIRALAHRLDALVASSDASHASHVATALQLLQTGAPSSSPAAASAPPGPLPPSMPAVVAHPRVGLGNPELNTTKQADPSPAKQVLPFAGTAPAPAKIAHKLEPIAEFGATAPLRPRRSAPATPFDAGEAAAEPQEGQPGLRTRFLQASEDRRKKGDDGS